MRLALTLGGTDYGRSGIGVYTRSIIPHIQQALSASSDEFIVVGTLQDIRSYEDILGNARRIVVNSAFTSPGTNALFHLAAAGPLLARARASVLLMPAANRRVVAHSPIPTVAVVHDLAQLRVAKKYDSLRMAYFRHAVLPSIRRASRVVAISECTKNDLVRALDWPPARITVVQNGVDAAKFALPDVNDDRAQRAKERLDLNSPYILYLSRLEHPGKNHLRLIEAFARSEAAAHHSLVLAGADWGALPRIREIAARFHVEHRVRIAGFVTDELVPGLVAGADAVAMVGLHEGFGLPALEALAAGRPVFVANTGALTEVTGDLAAICDPFDCVSIRQALEKTIMDMDFRQRARTEGPVWARRFGWDATAESLVSICREVARKTTNSDTDRIAASP
jgi:glycosyltransferase involved in cell wall biosynthesis